ncbi:UNVERIFIED_CONTAM: protein DETOXIFICATION 8 [Sesamum angustifolium]|uniref:Protein DETOXIFICATION 8 n=1 Tax=Sesamum angustifolium TaxID=2727405 RepID=A0AAW2NL64_9LAMI
MEPEQLLLVHENEGTRNDLAEKWEVLFSEVYKVIWLAWPMVVVSVSQYLVQAVPMMMLGHLDKLALSSAAIATSLSTVTGYSLIVRQAVDLDWPRPCNLRRSWKVFNLAHPFTVLLCHSSVIGSVSADSEFNSSDAVKYSSFSRPPSASFLGSYIQAKARKCWCSSFYSLEWWTVEIIILCGGLLPNPELETSVLSICTRVSNELGAGKAQAAQLAVSTVLVLSIVEFVIASTVILFAVINWDICLNAKCASATLCDFSVYCQMTTTGLRLYFNSFLFMPIAAGVARGSGWQHIGAYVNLGAYYLVGVPVSLLLGFVLPMKGKGLWCGLIAGAMGQSILLVIITFRTDWEKQAREARRRIFDSEGKLLNHDQLI